MNIVALQEINFYQSLGKISRRQIDYMFLNFSYKICFYFLCKLSEMLKPIFWEKKKCKLSFAEIFIQC